MPTIYPPLNIGAKRRLELFRKEATDPRWRRPMTWRDVRFAKLTSHTGLAAGTSNGEPILYTHNPVFTREKYAHEIIRLDHTGWYTDSYGDIARGLVVALPHGRFIAGYEWSSNGERVYFPTVYDDKNDAAQAADDEARRFAEQAQEDDAKYQAARELEDKIEDGLTRLRECIALRNKACMRYVRGEAQQLIENLREWRETLRTEYANYI